MNQVVDNYNISRSWLDQEMGTFGYLGGYSSEVGYMNKIWLEGGFNWRYRKRKAFGTDLFGDFGTRQLKFKSSCYGATIGWGVFESGFGFGIGARTELGNTKLLSRVYYPEDSGKGKFEKVNDHFFTLKSGPAIRIIIPITGGVYASLLLHYQYGIIGNNMTVSDQVINNTLYSGNQEIFDNSMHTFGFSISIGAYHEN